MVTVFLLATIILPEVIADDRESAMVPSGPYCGIYAIYGAACSIGKSCDFEDLLDGKFVSSGQGSTSNDLMLAGEKIGVHVVSESGLGVTSLLNSEDPMILHVASGGQLTKYNHWVLFLGVEDGYAKVVDSPEGIRLIKLSMLCAKWDGIALVVRSDDKPKPSYLLYEVQQTMIHLLLCCGILATIVCIDSIFSLKIRQVYIIGTTVFILSVCLIGETSVLLTFEANDYIYSAINDTDFDEIGFEELVVEMGDGNQNSLILVDARSVDSYIQGSIGKAINLPVDAMDYELERKLMPFLKDQPIVVFCQGKRCSFDDIMAKRIRGLGFRSIRVYTEGYRNWSARLKNR